MTPKVGSTASSYEILSKLAEGGMAEIFLARAASGVGVQRHVVLKRVSRERALDTQYVRMFLDEARLAAQLQHPNIAQVFDIGRLGASYFFTMEYVHGVTVQALVERARERGQRLPIDAVLAIVAGAAAGLGHAHQRVGVDGRPLGIVHRDVSPANLMVSFEGHVKVVDFGVAKAVGRPETQAGEIKGKVAYLSPEQCRLIKLDARSDLFSLGIVMWEMLTAKRLFKRATAFETMAAIATEQVPLPSTRRPDVPPTIDELAARLLALEPEDRFQSASELIDAAHAVALREQIPLTPATLARLLLELFGIVPEPWLALEREVVTVVAAPIPADLEDAGDAEVADVEQKLTTQFASVSMTPTPNPTPTTAEHEVLDDEQTHTTNVMVAVSARETRVVPVLANEEAVLGMLEPEDMPTVLERGEPPTMQPPTVPPAAPAPVQPASRPPSSLPRPSTRPPLGMRPPPPAPLSTTLAGQGPVVPPPAAVGASGSNNPLTLMGSGPYAPLRSSQPAAVIPGSGPRGAVPHAVPRGPASTQKSLGTSSLRWWILGGWLLGVALTTIIVFATRADDDEVIEPAAVADAAAVAVDAPIVRDAIASRQAIDAPEPDAAELDAAATGELAELLALDDEKSAWPPRRRIRTKSDLTRAFAAKRYKEIVAACSQLGASDDLALVCTLAACRTANKLAQDWYRQIVPADREATVKACEGQIEDLCALGLAECRP